MAHVLQQIYEKNGRISVLQLRQSDRPELVQLANYIYEKVFLNYTLKQWGGTPEQIDPETLTRASILLSRDCRYFQNIFQCIPEQGYTKIFEAMLDHLCIQLRLNADASKLLELSPKGVLLEGRRFEGPVICKKSGVLYRQYAVLAARFSNLFLLGRLAEYRYYNMDAVAARALSLARRLLTT